MMRSLLLTAATFAAASHAIAQDIDEVRARGECTLSYKGRIYAQGPCETVTYDQQVTELNGVVPQSGQIYEAIINEDDGSGVLLAAETFVLTDGPLVPTTAGALYAWPSGHAIDFEPSQPD